MTSLLSDRIMLDIVLANELGKKSKKVLVIEEEIYLIQKN